MQWKNPRLWVPALLIAILLLIYFSPTTAAFLYEAVAFLSPVWLPLLLIYLAWPLWLTFARSRYAASVPYETIELIPGPETPRTAHAMELVLYSLYHRSPVSKRDFLMGRVRMPWSFEIYGHAGKLRFFVYLPEGYREAVEARLRGEYSDLEIEHVQDYAREIPFDASMRAAGNEFALSKPDPYPIKTYLRWESEKKDPYGELLDELGRVGEREHILLSFIVRPHQREYTSYFKEPKDTLHEDAYAVIQGILGAQGNIHAVVPAKQNIVAAIESALKKPSFDCGIRALYLADPGAFNEEFAHSLPFLFERFNDADLNSFSPYDSSERANVLAREILKLSPQAEAAHLVRLFRRRAFFAPPYIGKAFILNTEELATLFHLPRPGKGSAVAHPAGIALEAPANLPI